PHSAEARRMTARPRREPAPDVAAVRHRGEVVKLVEQTAARKTLNESEGKGGATDASAGDAEGRPRLGVVLRMQLVVERFQADVAQRADRAAERFIDDAAPHDRLLLEVLGVVARQHLAPPV